jgi:hypothetical protein
MEFDTVWREIGEACSTLDPDAVLVTPSSERALTVAGVEAERIVVTFRERDQQRSLWRDQFEVLYERLRDREEGLSLSELPAGVEPYVAVASLGGAFEVTDGAIAVDGSGTAGESPFLRAEWEVRTRPERVHDDALLLAEQLEQYDLSELDEEVLEATAAGELVNLYVLLSDVQRGADELRRTVSDVLLDRIGPAGELHGQFGTVRRTTRERRRPKSDAEILDRLDEAGIPREWVLGVDEDKLDVVLAVTDLDEEAVYDADEQVYVQKTGVEEPEKHARLQGLRDRLAAVPPEEAERLREEVEDLESRIESALAGD